MSHFILGRIDAQADEERAVVIAKFLRLAENAGLTARLILAANAQLQFEILSAAGLSRGCDAIFFEIVGPSGTADELISPYVFFDSWPWSIKATLDKIFELAKNFLHQHRGHEISLVFSEGFDTHYEKCAVTAAVGTDLLLKRFSDCGEVPSLSIGLKEIDDILR